MRDNATTTQQELIMGKGMLQNHSSCAKACESVVTPSIDFTTVEGYYNHTYTVHYFRCYSVEKGNSEKYSSLPLNGTDIDCNPKKDPPPPGTLSLHLLLSNSKYGHKLITIL